MNEKAVRKLAKDIRINTLKMLNNLGFGHYGGSLSVVETLAVLYEEVLKYDSNNPKWDKRDYFILSKGHAGPALYSTLALKGFFTLEDLKTLNINGTKLPSHPDSLTTKGVDVTTGSLGQGISIATGIAKGLKIKELNNKVYCIIGDGESQEGQVWEAISYASHHNLNNLTVFVDYNKKQLDGDISEICNPLSFEDKFKSFGFDAVTIKGDDINGIYKACVKDSAKPKAIILDTIKGQGIKYIENLESNHHLRLNDENKNELENILTELERGANE